MARKRTRYPPKETTDRTAGRHTPNKPKLNPKRSSSGKAVAPLMRAGKNMLFTASENTTGLAMDTLHKSERAVQRSRGGVVRTATADRKNKNAGRNIPKDSPPRKKSKTRKK